MSTTIINWKNVNTKTFSQLEKGDVFVHKNELYMKIVEVNDVDKSSTWNSVDLATGGLVWHSSNVFVEPTDIEISVLGTIKNYTGGSAILPVAGSNAKLK